MVVHIVGAGQFSTSIMKPTPVDANGVISAPFPTGGQSTLYYFSVEAQPGDLLTQISYQGRAGADKQLELSLINENGKQGNSYWIHGSDPIAEGTRSFPIDKKGRQVVRLAVRGPETAQFRVELGGTAVSGVTPKSPQLHNGFSRSIFVPTQVGNDGVISGSLPGTEASVVYYFVANVKAGELLTQISYEGRDGAHKELTLRLLGPDARSAQWSGFTGLIPKKKQLVASQSIRLGARCFVSRLLDRNRNLPCRVGGSPASSVIMQIRKRQ